MSFPSFAAAAAILFVFITSVTAASSCPSTLTPTNSIKPAAASGYQMALVATGLTAPRSIEFDANGNLLVVQQGKGIIALTLQDYGGTCIRVKSSNSLVENSGLNHGLALSQDGKTLYASTAEAVYSWTYDPTSISLGQTNTTVISGMNTDDHTTRTLLVSKKINRTLLVSTSQSFFQCTR